jgi:hypothetical protein
MPVAPNDLTLAAAPTVATPLPSPAASNAALAREAPQAAADPTRSAAPSHGAKGSDTHRDATEHGATSRASNRERGSHAPGPHDELSLLERAERAVRARHPQLAIALTAELSQRHPTSALHEERRAIELMAHCQSGAAETAALAERFTARYPDSVYAERISGECR